MCSRRRKAFNTWQIALQAIVRQITASVTFLPLLEEPCTFDMLVYTDDDVQVDRYTGLEHHGFFTLGYEKGRSSFFVCLSICITRRTGPESLGGVRSQIHHELR